MQLVHMGHGTKRIENVNIQEGAEQILKINSECSLCRASDACVVGKDNTSVGVVCSLTEIGSCNSYPSGSETTTTK